MAVPSDYKLRVGDGYYKLSDGSGPYWADQAGVMTLMTSMTAIVGAATNSAYRYEVGSGYFHTATGAGPYAAS